jgi:hypothetical protein
MAYGTGLVVGSVGSGLLRVAINEAQMAGMSQAEIKLYETVRAALGVQSEMLVDATTEGKLGLGGPIGSVVGGRAATEAGEAVIGLSVEAGVTMCE